MRKRFGEVQALAGCSFSVARGRMLGFLGPNGAGKTTAMRAVFGLVEPDAGEVLWDGRPIGPDERLRFGYMPEERGLYPRMPVGEQLAYFGACTAWARPRRARRQRMARAARPGRSCRRDGRRALARQPAARAAGGGAACTSRSCSSSTSRSPVSTRSRCARSPTCSAARRRAAPPSSSRATSSSSSRTSARRSRSSTTAASSPRATWTRCRRASQRRRIELQLEGAPPGWLPDVAGVELVERRNGDLRLLADRDVDPEQVLAAARAVGAVVAFSYGPPSLAELFLELVAP